MPRPIRAKAAMEVFMGNQRMNMGVAVALGAGIGAALGTAMGNIAAGTASGAALGCALGAGYDLSCKRKASSVNARKTKPPLPADEET